MKASKTTGKNTPIVGLTKREFKTSHGDDLSTDKQARLNPLISNRNTPIDILSEKQAKGDTKGSSGNSPEQLQSEKHLRKDLISHTHTPVEVSASQKNSVAASPAQQQSYESKVEIPTSAELQAIKLTDVTSKMSDTTQQTNVTDVKRKDRMSKMNERYPIEYASSRLTDVKQVRVLVKQMSAHTLNDVSEDMFAEMTSQYLVQFGAAMNRVSSGADRRIMGVSTCSSAVDCIVETDPRTYPPLSTQVKKVHKCRPFTRPKPKISVASHVVQPPYRPDRDAERREENLTTLLRGRMARRKRQRIAVMKGSARSLHLQQRLEEAEKIETMSRRHLLEKSMIEGLERARENWVNKGMLETRSKVKIVIVGAGLAGLSAAAKLLNQGFMDVKILEASQRVGGRLETVRLHDVDDIDHGSDHLQWAACSAELGAPPYVWEDSGDFIYDLAQSHGLLSCPNVRKRLKCQVLTSKGRLLPERLVSIAHKFWYESERETSYLYTNVFPTEQREHMSLALSDCANVRRRHLLQRHGLSGENTDLETALDCVANLWRCAAGDSCGDGAAGLPVIQGQSCNIRLGQVITHVDDAELPLGIANPTMTSVRKDSEVVTKLVMPTLRRIHLSSCMELCKVLMNDFPPGTVQFGQRVVQLDWSSFCTRTVRTGGKPRMMISCSDKNLYCADHVIMAVPLGHLKKFSSTLFKPSLPSQKLAAIDRMGVGLVSKIVLYYRDPPWQAPFHLVFAGKKSGDVGYDDTSLSSRCLQIITPLLSLQVIEVILLGDLPQRAATDDIHVRAEISTILSYKFRRINIPPPDQIVRSSWGQNPLFLGSHPYWRRGCHSKDIERLARPVNFRQRPVIQFAGDFTGPNYGRLTHSARASGLREAQRLVNFYDAYFGYENANPIPSEVPSRAFSVVT